MNTHTNTHHGTTLEYSKVNKPQTDASRRVRYIDRRLQIVQTMVNVGGECAEVVRSIMSDPDQQPTYFQAVETLQFIAAYYLRGNPESRVFSDMSNGGLVRNWHNSLIAMHVKLHGAQ